MKILIALLLVLLTIPAYAGERLTNITGTTVATGDDIIYIVDDPSGTPASRYISKSEFLDTITSTNISSSRVSGGGYIHSDNTIGADGIVTGVVVSGDTVTAEGTLTVQGTDWNVGTNLDADVIVDGSTNAIPTLTQETNWDNHLSNDGTDHSYIDQDVTSGKSPTFDGANFTGDISVWTNDSGYISTNLWTDDNSAISPITHTTISSTIVQGGVMYADISVGSPNTTGTTVSGNIVNIADYTLDKNEDLGDVNIADDVWTVEDLTITSEAQGTILYYDGSNWVVLAVGTSGQVLHTQGAGSDPIWDTDDSGGGTGAPGGSDQQVQYNDGTNFGGDAGFTYNLTTNTVTATTILSSKFHTNGDIGAEGSVTGTTVSGNVVNFGGESLALPSETPTNDYIIKYDSGAGTLSWEAETSETATLWKQDSDDPAFTVTPISGTTVSSQVVTANTVKVGGDYQLDKDEDLGDVNISDGTWTVEDLTMTSEAQGTILFYDGSNWVVLAVGSSGDVLHTNGAGSDPTWDTDDTGASGLGFAPWEGHVSDDGFTLLPITANRVSAANVTCLNVTATNVSFGYNELLLPPDQPTDNQIIKYDSAKGEWALEADAGAGGGTKQVNFTISDDGGWDSEFVPIFIAPKDNSITITQIDAAISDGTVTGSVSFLRFNVEERAFASLGSAGSDLLTAELETGLTGTSIAAFADSAVASKSHLIFTTENADVEVFSSDGVAANVVSIHGMISYTDD